jgi:hypothetical protein
MKKIPADRLEAQNKIHHTLMIPKAARKSNNKIIKTEKEWERETFESTQT